MNDVPISGQDERVLALLEALGFAAQDRVVSLRLAVSAKDFVTIEVERYVVPRQFDQLVTELKKYKLVPKDDGV